LDDVILGPQEVVAGRPFTDIAHTMQEEQVLRKMLVEERARVTEWAQGGSSQGRGVVLRGRNEVSCRFLLVIPDVESLTNAPDLSVVGFFGAAREDVDHTILFSLEDELVDDMAASHGAGLLSYFDLELDERGGYGNLVLFATPEASEAWPGNPIHRRAIEIAPLHYTTIRLHKGVVPGGLMGHGELKISRTRYLDFTGDVDWRGIRSFPELVG
jgi:hypothetical protein